MICHWGFILLVAESPLKFQLENLTILYLAAACADTFFIDLLLYAAAHKGYYVIAFSLNMHAMDSTRS